MIRLRVATFNIRNGLGWDGLNIWPLRRRTTARTIAALGADVIALQEVHRFQQRYLARQLPNYRFVGEGRDGNGRGERCPVLAHPGTARIVGHRTIWFGDTPELAGTRLPGAGAPRIATIVRLDLGDGATVEVTSTHLDEASTERRLIATRQLIDTLDRTVPNLVLGDLNSDPDSEVLSAFIEAGLQPVIPDPDCGTEHRFTGRTDGRRIDHILASHHFTRWEAEVVTSRRGPVWPSDHFPVLAELELRMDDLLRPTPSQP